MLLLVLVPHGAHNLLGRENRILCGAGSPPACYGHILLLPSLPFHPLASPCSFAFSDLGPFSNISIFHPLSWRFDVFHPYVDEWSGIMSLRLQAWAAGSFLSSDTRSVQSYFSTCSWTVIPGISSLRVRNIPKVAQLWKLWLQSSNFDLLLSFCFLLFCFCFEQVHAVSAYWLVYELFIFIVLFTKYLDLKAQFTYFFYFYSTLISRWGPIGKVENLQLGIKVPFSCTNLSLFNNIRRLQTNYYRGTIITKCILFTLWIFFKSNWFKKNETLGL